MPFSNEFNNSEYDCNNEIKAAVEKQFDKHFRLPSYISQDNRKNVQLPPVSTWFGVPSERWVDIKLESMKDELNATKSLLTEKPLDAWHRHTRFRNPAADVIGRVRHEAEKAELLTQVFIDCYASGPWLPSD